MTPKPSLRALHLCFAIVPFLISTYARADRIIYVNQSAIGTNDGTSWTDAYLDLQDALDDARLDDPSQCEIWVAAGTYNPDRGTGDPTMVYDLPGGISIYGSFVGWEACVDERNISQNPTILDGDLLANDDLTIELTSSCCTPTYEPGCDNQGCMGLVLDVAPFLMNRCPDKWDHSCASSALEVCGELCRPSRSDNSYGLMILNDKSANVLLDGLTIINADGFCNQFDVLCPGIGALYVNDTLGLTVRNCRFSDNRARYLYSAAAEIRAEAEVIFENCQFTNNAHGYFNEQVVDIGRFPYSHTIFAGCDFVGNGGAVVLEGSGTVEHCNFIGNSSSALSIQDNGVTIIGCNFIDNIATAGNSVLNVSHGGFISNCRFLNNTANYYTLEISDSIYNSIIAGNVGNGVRADSSRLVNCVVYGNQGVGVFSTGNTSIIDSILWANVDDVFHGEDAQFRSSSGATLQYNSIEGWTGALGGIGNVGLEPMFADPDGEDDMMGTLDDDFRLSPDSPLINLGHPMPPFISYQDLDGHARRMCSRVDMGAYEFGIGDYNCDRVVEPADFANFPVCFTGPAPAQPYSPTCAAYDFVTEVIEDVDLLDFAGLQNDR